MIERRECVGNLGNILEGEITIRVGMCVYIYILKYTYILKILYIYQKF